MTDLFSNDEFRSGAMWFFILIVLLLMPALGLAQTGPSGELMPIPDIATGNQPGNPAVRSGPAVDLGAGIAITPPTRTAPSQIVITPGTTAPQTSPALVRPVIPAVPITPNQPR
jgi:hypothetical protein